MCKEWKKGGKERERVDIKTKDKEKKNEMK